MVFCQVCFVSSCLRGEKDRPQRHQGTKKTVAMIGRERPSYGNPSVSCKTRFGFRLYTKIAKHAKDVLLTELGHLAIFAALV